MYLYNNPYVPNNNYEDESNLMTPQQLSVYLGIGRNMTYQLLNEGIIKGFKIGKNWKVSKEAVAQYIAQQSHMIR